MFSVEQVAAYFNPTAHFSLEVMKKEFKRRWKCRRAWRVRHGKMIQERGQSVEDGPWQTTPFLSPLLSLQAPRLAGILERQLSRRCRSLKK